MTLRFTCKCKAAISMVVDWSEGDDKFTKTETCGACGEVLKMRELPLVTPSHFKDIYYQARIAVQGHFTLANKTIIDGDITWKAKFYGQRVMINTVNGGGWELDEGTFRRIATAEANRVRREMPADVEEGGGEEEEDDDNEEEEDDDNEEEEKGEVEEDSNDDSDNSDKRDWKYIKYNMEHAEEDWLDKRQERLEKMRKKRAKERRKKMKEIEKIMECRPFSVGLCVSVHDLEEDEKKKKK
ncbi:hypothetical protein L2E82_34268 [Cichorium intybus]|uniref:Uncharacterized protein n=1 Tax=Cichorium intybus TaxID=13427 RepID=A0ACB9BLV9_CICIN|nr:hypothetical protein L2E82_34268 [Cichorium intybus]